MFTIDLGGVLIDAHGNTYLATHIYRNGRANLQVLRNRTLPCGTTLLRAASLCGLTPMEA